MYSFRSENFDLKQIAESGQTFRWRAAGDGNAYEIPAFGRRVTIAQDGNSFEISCDEREWNDIWRPYFDMDTDYAAVGERILSSDDEYLKEAYRYGSGIRILRQELWETLISFMISQNNNIPRIRSSVQKLCDRFTGDGHFPRPGELDPEVFEDSGLGLGYRAPYLRDMYAYGAAHPDFPERLKSLGFDEAFDELISFKGIGKKVASCVALFALHHIDAFPIDTHIKKILALHYPDGFDFERYKGFAGIVQQYIFYYDLSL